MVALRKPIEKVIREIESCNALDGLSEQIAHWVQGVTASDSVKHAISGTWIGH